MQKAIKVEKRVVIDLDYCIGCRSCSAACFYGHRDMPNVNYGESMLATTPIICRQCEDPACVAACPSGAMHKDEFGLARRSRMLCIGCRSCVTACPFGVLSSDLTKCQVAKCDLCADRVQDGNEPRCVTTCTTGALRFIKVDDVQKEGLILLSGRTAGHSPIKRR